MARITELKPRVSLLNPASRRALIVNRIRGRASQRMRDQTLSADPLCVHCRAAGRIAAATEVDHTIPLWQGGRDDQSNRQGLCRACHTAKSAAEAAQRARGG